MKPGNEDFSNEFDPKDFSAEGLDAQTFQKMVDALKREPTYTLPVYFADRLVTLIESKEKTKEASRDNLWLGLGLFSMVIALTVAFLLTDFKATVGVFRFLAGSRALVFFGVSFILILHWLDKKILRKVEAF